MKLNLISFLGISLLISAALTPVVCEIIIYFFGSLPYPFSRVFDRVILAVALILMATNAPAIKKGAISSQIRLAVSKISESTVGFLVSAISGMSLIAIYIYLGDLTLKPIDDVAYLIRKLVLVIPAAFLIAVIEEFFFRSFVLKKLALSFPIFISMILTSLLYAAVHFLTPVKKFPYNSGDIFSGFEYIVIVLREVANPNYLPAFGGLFLVGMVLADFVRQRKNSLSYAIGTHAGWIVAIKVATFVTVATSSSTNNSEILRRYHLVSQPSGWLGIIVVWYLGRYYFVRKSTARVQQSG